jgi:DNA sulfur modification protein DndC
MTKALDTSSYSNMAFKANYAISILKKYYLKKRSLCVAFSGGKDSTAVVYLLFSMLHNLNNNNIPLNNIIYIINSNTLAELPPLLKHLKSSLHSIQQYSNKHNFPIVVEEVFPRTVDTLNVQLLGVGMPPPSSTFRWCTDKLKINPIDAKIKHIFSNGKFISVIGTRKDESFSRSSRIKRLSLKGTDLKINDRYPNASNLMPIENWSTKDVWEYLFKQKNDLIDVDFLWQLYSDASGENAAECSFVGAGGKDINDGKIGCGASRFGCWQCYMVRDTDKSLDGLLNSNYKDIELYKEYRDWYWQINQAGWEKTRDPYNHRTHMRDFYNRGGQDSPKFGMTMPKGVILKIRKKSFKKLLSLQSKLDEIIITDEEIVEIQKRWVLEGDLELSAFKISRKYGYEVNSYKLTKLLRKQIIFAKYFYKQNLSSKNIRNNFSILTLKRFAIQYTIYPQKINNKFFPSKKEESFIKKEWKFAKKFERNNEFMNLYYLIRYNISNFK